MSRKSLTSKESYEFLDEIIERDETEKAARKLSTSPGHLRKQCRAPESEDEYASGHKNFIDRILDLYDFLKVSARPERSRQIMEFIAAKRGYLIVDVTAYKPRSFKEIEEAAMKIGKESGDVFDALINARDPRGPGGRKVTVADLERLKAELEDLASVVIGADKQVYSMIEKTRAEKSV